VVPQTEAESGLVGAVLALFGTVGTGGDGTVPDDTLFRRGFYYHGTTTGFVSDPHDAATGVTALVAARVGNIQGHHGRCRRPPVSEGASEATEGISDALGCPASYPSSSKLIESEGGARLGLGRGPCQTESPLTTLVKGNMSCLDRGRRAHESLPRTSRRIPGVTYGLRVRTKFRPRALRTAA